MNKLAIKNILENQKHRNWEIPKRTWSYYQEWNNAIFLHWKIDVQLLEELVPKSLKIDTIDGKAWVSAVAFTMEKIRPKGLPAFPPISNFLEINLRTYVTKNEKPGVFFLNIEAGNSVAAFISNKISGLPYQKSEMKHDLVKQEYTSNFKIKNFNFSISYEVEEIIDQKTALDIFLTERYCLYLENNNKLYRYEIHHLPWQINKLKYSELTTNYTLNKINLNRKPDAMHYSKGVQVVAWNKETIIL